jgi:Domain of unknown function (DUF4419)
MMGRRKLVIKELFHSKDESIVAENQFEYFFQEIIKLIQDNTVSGVVDEMKCDFSTTDSFYTLASTAVVMSTLKSYFEYERCMTMCGINNIMFKGVRSDWEKLIHKIQLLRKYDVNGVLLKYIDHVEVLLKKFLDTFDGIVDLTFWNTIMATEQQRLRSGENKSGTKITGLILEFVGIYSTVDLSDVPDGSFEVPIDMVNEWTQKRKKLKMLVSFCGVVKENKYLFKPLLDISISVLSEESMTAGDNKRLSCAIL